METIGYKEIERNYPWLFKERQKTIISPDVDGLLCGLFMSNFQEWEIVGFYDGKILCYRNDVNFKECIFLDIEIFREGIKSCGHHMLSYNYENLPNNWNNFQNALNPNNIRKFDMLHFFERKYPFATIHFLLCCFSEIKNIKIRINDISTVPLLYVNGIFKNLLNYPENCSEWLLFLNAKNPHSPIYPIFEIFSKQKLKDIIHLLQSIFKEFENIKLLGKGRGDKILLKEIIKNSFSFNSFLPLLEILSKYTGWEFRKNCWNLSELKNIQFEKEIKSSINGKLFKEIVEKLYPLSWAITAKGRMEYTIDVLSFFC